MRTVFSHIIQKRFSAVNDDVATDALAFVLESSDAARRGMVLEHESLDDPRARGDLTQLRGLCDAADGEAFTPASKEQLSDQRMPAFIIELSAVVRAAVDLAVTENVLSINKLRPAASWEWIGRYAWVGDRGAGAWFGIHFGLWKAHGATPLWLLFWDTEFGRVHEVRRLIEPWAAKNHKLAVTVNREFAIALDVAAGQEKESVVRDLVEQLRAIAQVLNALPPKSTASVEPESDEVPQ
jgi:hypothetical protein